MADGYIDIDVRLNDSQASSQANQIGKQLGQQISSSVDSASKEASKSSQQAIEGIGTALTGYGTAMSKAVTVPILAAATASGAAAVKIDTALTGVRKTVDGTEEQYEALKDAAIEFSQTNAVDPAQILDIQALGAQLGYTIDELDMFGEVVSGLDIATNMNAEEAATELAQFANIMGMAHDETKNYGSTIVDLGNNFATTEADISHMAMRIAGAGKQIGMSEADVLGMATALSSMGINAEAGGTAISTIMSNIDKAVATSSDKLETWASAAGMSAQEFADAWKANPVEALSTVLAGMDAATEEGGNMSVMLEELGINAIRQTDTLKRLANNVDMLPQAVDTANKAWEENVALDKEVENRNASMAAQLQILWNKVQAVAVEVGEPLMEALIAIIDAADPLIDALASGAKAFADLDEDGQRVVLMAIAAAAAFGPLTTGVGKLLTASTKSATAWKQFGDNLRNIRTNLITAGDAANKSSALMQKYFTTTKNGVTTVYKWDKATQGYIKTTDALDRAIATQATTTQQQTAATKVSTAAMNVAKGAARAFGTALKTIAPVAIFSALVGIVGKVSESMQKAKEHAENYDKATRGLEQAVMTTTSAIQAENSAFEQQQQKIESIDIDAFLEEHAQLADTIKESAEAANTSVGLLDKYSDSIANLADRSDLTEPEIAELKQAVDDVNEATGQSYTVAQDADGAWRVMADGAAVAKDSILQLIEAQQLQIQAEAAGEQYKDVYAQLQKDAEAYQNQLALVTEKKDLLTKAQERYNGLDPSEQTADEVRNLAILEEQLNTEQQKLNELSGAMGSTQSAANKLTEQQNLYNMALSEGATDVTKMVAGSAEMMAAIQATGTPLDQFVDNMNQMGISAEQLSGIMETEGSAGIQNFAKAYQGGSEELLKWAQEHGIDIPQAYIDGMKKKESDVAEASRQEALIAGQAYVKGLGENEQAIIDKASGLTGIAVGELGKLAEGAEISGKDGVAAFALAVADGSIQAGMSSEQVVQAVNEKLELVKGKEIGTDEINKYAQAIRDGESPTDAAAKMIANTAAAGLQSQNANASTWGGDLVSNLASGIRNAKDAIVGACSSIAGAIAGILGHSVPKEGILREGGEGEAKWGRHLVENIASGMTSSKARSSVKAASKEVAKDISDELLAQFAAMDAMGQIEASIGRGMSTASIIANSGGISNTNTTWNINQPIATPDELMRQQRMMERYQLAGSR